jgi:hypothetical protein
MTIDARILLLSLLLAGAVYVAGMTLQRVRDYRAMYAGERSRNHRGPTFDAATAARSEGAQHPDLRRSPA